MKKLISVLVLLFVLCPVLVSCHGARGLDAFVLPDTLDTSKEYHITFWAKNDTNKTQTDIYQKAIRDFEAMYPFIKVEMRLYTDYTRIYNDVITNIATQTTPNVCITYPDHIATYLTGSNVVVPLDALLSSEKYGLGGTELAFDAPTSDEMIPQFLTEGKIEGVQYAIPYMRSTEACYVNKDYVEKLGFTLPETLTWDFIWEVSEAAVEKDDDGNYKVNGQKVMIPFIYKSTDNMMIQYLYQKGAPYAEADGSIGIFSEQTKDFLREISGHAETGAFSTFKISSYPANFLNAGQCIFAVDSTAGATWMGSKAPLLDISEDKLVDFETVVYPVPQADPENMRMISQGPSICVFNKRDPQEVLASWLFAEYLLTNEVQIAYSETEGYVPVTKKAQESEEYHTYLAAEGSDGKEHYEIKIKAAKLLLDHVGETFVTPVFNGSAPLRNAAGQLIEDVTLSVKRHQTVDEAYFTKLFKNTSTLYRLGENGPSAQNKELGPLPAEAVILLVCLGIAWIGIASVFLFRYVKAKKGKEIVKKRGKVLTSLHFCV